MKTSVNPVYQVEKLKALREYRRLFARAITPDIRAEDTVDFVKEEMMVLWMVESAPGGTVKLWTALNNLSCAVHGTTHVHLSRPERQKLMATLQRLIKEKKVFRYRPTNTLSLTDTGRERLTSEQVAEV